VSAGRTTRGSGQEWARWSARRVGRWTVRVGAASARRGMRWSKHACEQESKELAHALQGCVHGHAFWCPSLNFQTKGKGGGIRCRKSRNNFMHHLKTVHVPVQGTFPANVPAEEKGHAFPRMSITHLTSRRLRDLPATSRFRDLPIAGPTCSPAQKDRRFRALPIAGPTRSPAG